MKTLSHFDLLQWQEIAKLSLPKKAAIAPFIILAPRARRFLVTWSGNEVGYKLSRVALGTRMSFQQHFARIFASEAMTLPEIDHVPFLQGMRRHFSPVKVGGSWWVDARSCGYQNLAMGKTLGTRLALVSLASL